MARNTVPESVSMETPEARDATMKENARRATAVDPWLRFIEDAHRLGYGVAVDKHAGGLRPVYPELWLADASGAAQLARFGVRGLAAAIRGSVAGSIPVDVATVGRNALALESVRARHNLGNLRMWRNTDLEELGRVVRTGWQESPSIGVSRIDSPSYIMPTTGYNAGSGSVPVVFHYRRDAFDFDVRPGHHDVAIPWDSASPTSRTVAEELAAGKTYDDILRGWVDRQGGAGPGVGDITFANGSPRVLTISEKTAKIKAEEAAMKELGIRRPYEDPRPQVATGNRLDETWDRVRMASDQWGEVKPLRKVPAGDAVDFVEIPRYRYVRDPVSGYAREEWIPRGERFALQRRLEAEGIRYRTFDTSGFYGAGAPPGIGDFRPRMSEFLSGEVRGPGVTVPRITPQAFHEAAKAGDSPDRFSMSRNFLATDKVPDTIFGIPVVSNEDDYTPEDLAFFREHPEAGGYYDLGEETPEDGSAEGAPTQADEAGDTNPYAGMTTQQKLDRADELLKQWEGTARYDAFKKRVDEMHAKYGQPGETSYSQMADKAVPVAKQGISTLYNIAAGGGGTDLGLSQVADTMHDTYQAASQRVIKAGRNNIAKFVSDAGRQAAKGIGGHAMSEAEFAREVAADLTKKGDMALAQKIEGSTKEAVNMYKHANDMKKTAVGLEETAQAAKASASRAARVKAMNHVIDTGYQQTVNTAARKAGLKAAAKVGVKLGARAVAGSVGPAAVAAGAVGSALEQGAALADTMKNTGATWSDVGKATGDVFTTKQGWKNLGWGLLGSLKDVASSVTFGAVDGGDKLRERMQDAKGGKTVRADAGGGEAEEFMKRNPTLFSHVKSFEKLRLEPYEDVGGHAIGYGAHADAAGNAVTADTPAIDEATADALLARDLYARREKLARTLPNWNRIPGSARQALLDVSMGKDGILSARKSKGLHADLAAAGEDPAKLLAAVKKHYYSYLSEDPKYRAGLMARRVAGGKTFFGEDFSYEGKTWDPAVGFTATAAPSLPAKKRKASGGSTRSKGER